MHDEAAKLLAGAVVALWGVAGTLLAVIRHLYDERLKDRDAEVAKLERRIEKMEAWDEQRDRASERYVETLERAVDLLDRQAGVAEATLARPPRRRGGGSD